MTLTEEQLQRGIEGAALAILIERHPDLLTLADLLEDMCQYVNAARRAAYTARIERAVDELVAVELLRRREAVLEPTPAALRAGEIELGL